MRNLELLKATREFILKNPAKHDQADWIEVREEQCNTTMCFAGHAAVLAGAEQPRDFFSWRVDEDGKLTEVVNGYRSGGMLIEDYAREKLGMTYAEAEWIFYCMDNSTVLNRIDQLVEAWESGEDVDTYDYGYDEYDEEEDYEDCQACEG